MRNTTPASCFCVPCAMASEEADDIVPLAKKKKTETEELNVSDLELDEADIANMHGKI